MSETKRLRMDFYRIEMPGSEPFETIFKTAKDRRGDDRSVEIGDDFVCLRLPFEKRPLIGGEFLRIRMNQIPLRAKRSGVSGIIQLAEDEGIGEETAFLYHAATKVLVLQRHRPGVTVNSFARYFERIGSLQEPIGIDPVLQPEAMKRVARMETVKRLEVRVAGTCSDSFLKDGGFGTSALLDLQQRFAAPSVSIELSMGRTPGSLLTKAVAGLARTVQKAFGGENGEVSKLRVSGFIDGDPAFVDLLADRLFADELIELDSNRRLPCQPRLDAMENQWRQRKSELAAMFEAPAP